ncbi:hypothetical protein C8R46DRAFT_1222921 [Mycena filopes]|nr:hypothetical protein C8R46DRAFT_1222921 [Mycena filopes]
MACWGVGLLQFNFELCRIAQGKKKDLIYTIHALATAQLLLGVAPPHVNAVASGSSSASAITFQLSEEERLRSLEQEIFAIRTRAQARRAAAAGEPVEEPEQPIRASPPPASNPAPAPAPAPAPPVILRRPAAPPAPPSQPSHPEHPFANARDAAYAPPRDRNVGARPNAAQQKTPEPAYRSTAPVYDPKIATTVFNRSMDAQVLVSQRHYECRVASNPADKSSNNPAAPVDQLAFDSLDSDVFHDSLANQKAHDSRAAAFFDSMPGHFDYSATAEIPPGATVIPDIYESYFTAGEAIPDDLIVSCW